ncbi:hypothetical protein B0H15DRAFT_84794 [Mycena belliarum]|uniref:Uncharacterized protein n=1 Tax=Mycena belliarum TaxID=1033014 RepID=A0AAD6XIF3_9AGAR|nr:hypothetical protein B0H15DRAFT_84794 [Mycena belliae]
MSVLAAPFARGPRHCAQRCSLRRPRSQAPSPRPVPTPAPLAFSSSVGRPFRPRAVTLALSPRALSSPFAPAFPTPFASAVAPPSRFHLHAATLLPRLASAVARPSRFHLHAATLLPRLSSDLAVRSTPCDMCPPRSPAYAVLVSSWLAPPPAVSSCSPRACATLADSSAYQRVDGLVRLGRCELVTQLLDAAIDLTPSLPPDCERRCHVTARSSTPRSSTPLAILCMHQCGLPRRRRISPRSSTLRLTSRRRCRCHVALRDVRGPPRHAATRGARNRVRGQRQRGLPSAQRRSLTGATGPCARRLVAHAQLSDVPPALRSSPLTPNAVPACTIFLPNALRPPSSAPRF